MKAKLEFIGDFFEDKYFFKMIIHADEMRSAIHEAKEKIRSRLKWGEDLTDAEESILEEIREILYIEGIE